jgi:hypothetical protein
MKIGGSLKQKMMRILLQRLVVVIGSGFMCVCVRIEQKHKNLNLFSKHLKKTKIMFFG